MTEYSRLQLRPLEDMLAAERSLRESIEADRRALASLLYDLAMRLDGERMEALRLADPGIPLYWTAEDWRKFFQDVQPPQPAPALPAAWIARQPSKPPAASPPPPPQTGVQRSEDGTVAQAPLRRIPPAAENPLAAFSEPRKPTALRMSGLLKGKRWRRGAMALYLIARRGLNLVLEIDLAITRVEPELTALRSNSVRAPLAELEQAGYLIGETLAIRKADFSTTLRACRLSEKGRALCFQLGWNPVESDWERLITRHEGLRFPEHTAAVLLFAVHARRRGYQVDVVPETEGAYAPDVRLLRDGEQTDVEVELGTKERPAKWRNMAAAQGFAALCAAAPEARKRLVADCKAAGIRGKAADLQTLKETPLDAVSPDTPLWAEEFHP